MEIGIKFCGGCNPKYDRGYIAKLLMKKLSEYNVEYIKLEKEYDVVIILQGCQVGCANQKGIKAKIKYNIYSIEDYENLNLF